MGRGRSNKVANFSRVGCCNQYTSHWPSCVQRTRICRQRRAMHAPVLLYNVPNAVVSHTIEGFQKFLYPVVDGARLSGVHTKTAYEERGLSRLGKGSGYP